MGLFVSAMAVLSATASRAAGIEALDFGLTSGGALVEASRVAAGSNDAPIVALVGGLAGTDESTQAVTAAVDAYAARGDRVRPFTLIAIPAPNPEAQALVFPPMGAAYRENAESYALWRRLGLMAPDLVLVVGEDPAGFASALSSRDVAGVAPIAAQRVDDASALLDAASALLDAVPAKLDSSPAHVEIDRRRARTPEQLAKLLAPIYGQTFDTPWYLYGMGLIAHLEMGDLDLVEKLAEPYVDGTKNSLQAGPNGVSTLVLAGHLVFAELAEQTGDPRYLERARAAADTCFDENGRMLEAVPNHGEMSDAIFMGASILAAVGHLTGERRYFDMAARQIAFKNNLVHRDDGLYRHSPLTDAAWGRGNGFAAIGYALTLSKLPRDHPAYAKLMSDYVTLMKTLARWQNEDGSWSQVIDHPGAYHETSGTAIIGFSIQRGLNRGWLDAREFGDVAARAFMAVSTRTDADGGFIDVSESTNKQPSLDAYLEREAVFGRDQRTGSFAMLFAVERAAAQ